MNSFLFFRRCAVLALLGLESSLAIAQPAASPKLTRAVDAAWLRAVTAAEADGAVLRADARRVAAQSVVPAPPTIELFHRDAPWSRGRATRETEAGAAVPLWLPGQSGARRAAAEADVAAAEAQRRYERWQLAGHVRDAGWAVVAAHAEQEQARAAYDALQRLTDDVERRVKAGESARADSLAARAETLAAQTTLREATLRALDAVRRWSLLTGASAPDTSDLTEISIDSSDQHPALRWANFSLEYAERNVDAVRSVRRDPPELLFNVRHEDDGPGTARNTVGIGVRIPFGGDVRNRARDAEAVTALDLAQRQLDATRQRLESDLAQARDTLAAAQARVDSEQMRQALARERSELMRKAFDAGELGLPEVLRSLSAAAAATSDLTRAQASLGLARARLAQAQGVTP